MEKVHFISIKNWFMLSLMFVTLSKGYLNAQTSIDKTFKIKVSTTPNSTTIAWDKNILATSYRVDRKLRSVSSWSVLVNNLSINDTTYTDATTEGVGYEYRLVGGSINTGYAYGYAYTAYHLPATHLNGTIILAVDSAYINYCAAEILQFKLDLIKEGWFPKIIYIGRKEKVTIVKQKIVAVYNQDPTKTKGLILLGHIPVPYSGEMNPDGHPDHRGAWPTDAYYADASNSYWTDTYINTTSASRLENRNIPGDGKFDQSNTSSTIMNLYVGRIDMYNLPDIDSNDSLLMKNYFTRDHAYRTMQKTYRMRCLVDDNFGYFGGEAFAQNGFRNGINLLGKDSVSTGHYFTDMQNSTYLWSYGCGGGWYQGASGVGTTASFKTNVVQSVFTMLFGSYFGDWDNTNNFLRAPLASSSGPLTNCWAGRPNWFFHHMALGEPIGTSVIESMRNYTTYIPGNSGVQMVHVSFLGDPTLKMYLYAPPASFTAQSANNGSQVNCTWAVSPDADVLGYYLYRANSINGSFTLITPEYITGTSFVDVTAPQGNNVYMLRAVKLQNTNSGTFYNLSNGLIDSTNLSNPLAVTLQSFSVQAKDLVNVLTWVTSSESNNYFFTVQKSPDGRNFDDIAEVNSKALDGNSNATLNYNFYDTKPYLGYNFYRLRETDFISNKVTFSKIVYINFRRESSKMNVYPNPSTTHLQVDIIEAENIEASLQIVDIQGRIIRSLDIHLVSGENKFVLPIQDLNKGIYQVSLFDKSDILKSIKFIKD